MVVYEDTHVKVILHKIVLRGKILHYPWWIYAPKVSTGPGSPEPVVLPKKYNAKLTSKANKDGIQSIMKDLVS